MTFHRRNDTPSITKAAVKLACRLAIIDGEVIVQNKDGISDFEELKSAIRWCPQSLIFCAFDMLHLKVVLFLPLLLTRWESAESEQVDSPQLKPYRPARNLVDETHWRSDSRVRCRRSFGAFEGPD